MTGGYAGDSSDDCTSTKDKVLAGYTAITKDSNDEAVAGTMINRGIGQHGTGSGLNTSGLYYYIPSGYYPLEGSNNPWVYMTKAEVASSIGLTAGKLLKGQTVLDIAGTATSDANATASQILSGKTVYVNGSKITGTLTVTSVVSFSVAQYSNLTLMASWAKPSKGPWSGLRIMCKQGGYPSSASDGTLFYEGSGTSATKSLAAGTWYFRAWNYMTTNAGRIYGGYIDKTASNNTVKGTQTFTSSGTFTVPANVRSIDIFCVGGGGGGTYTSGDWGGCGGGGGYTKTWKNISVSPGQAFTVTIGTGGVGGVGIPAHTDGGSTSVGNYSVAGGKKVSFGSRGPSGGSGGGHSGWGRSGSDALFCVGGNGGSNGGNGSNDECRETYTTYDTFYGGSGQGTTTAAFETGTVYAGGGGGGGSSRTANSTAGTGGSGGGGNASVHGTANTGGGGGGGGRASNTAFDQPAGNGGSGIAIIRWGY